jgi:hypothetical protein
MFHFEPLTTYDSLRTRFANEKVFLKTINTLAELDHGKSIKD